MLNRQYVLAFAALFTVCFVAGIRFVNKPSICHEKAFSVNMNTPIVCEEKGKIEPNNQVWVFCRCPQ